MKPILFILCTLFLASCNDQLYIQKANVTPPTTDNGQPVIQDSLLKKWKESLPSDFSSQSDGFNNFKIAINENDQAVIAWTFYDFINGSQRLYKSHYINSTWIHPLDMNDFMADVGSSIFLNEVKLAENGEAIITWSENDSLFRSHYKNSAWSHELIRTIVDSTRDYTEHTTKMSSNGEILMSWIESSKLFYTHYLNGNWTAPAEIRFQNSQSFAVDYMDYVRFEIANNGRAILAWKQLNHLNATSVYKATLTAGVWTTPANRTDFTTNEIGSEISVAINSSGHASVGWDQYSTGTDFYIITNRGSGWSAPLNLSQSNTGIYETKSFMSSMGESLIVWHDGNYLVVKKYANGSWSTLLSEVQNSVQNLKANFKDNNFQLAWAGSYHIKQVNCSNESCPVIETLANDGNVYHVLGSAAFNSKRSVILFRTQRSNPNGDSQEDSSGVEIYNNNDQYVMPLIRYGTFSTQT